MKIPSPNGQIDQAPRRFNNPLAGAIARGPELPVIGLTNVASESVISNESEGFPFPAKFGEFRPERAETAEKSGVLTSSARSDMVSGLPGEVAERLNAPVSKTG